MNEIWKPVPGYEGRYEVSDQGRVRSLPRDVEIRMVCGTMHTRHYKGRVLSLFRNRCSGPVKVRIIENQVEERFSVDHLVLAVFGDKSKTSRRALHRDGDPWNNAIDNLEWKRGETTP